MFTKRCRTGFTAIRRLPHGCVTEAEYPSDSSRDSLVRLEGRDRVDSVNLLRRFDVCVSDGVVVSVLE